MEFLTELLRRPAVSWYDVLDVAIVSILIYELLLLIRGTRAVQMALSGGFLIGLFFVSRWLQLETVHWLIRNLAGYVVFAIIVLFQADIRRALAHFGRAPFFRYFERLENDAVAVVVSEETGTISLVRGGGSERGVTPERLRSRLHILLSRRPAAEHRDARSAYV